MNHRSLTEEPRAALGGTRGPHGWEGLTYDRWNQGCAQKEAAGKAACGHIPGSPRPCGNRPKVSPAAEEPWLGRADPWGGKEPELGSPVSSDESLPCNQASTARQDLSSRSHSEPKDAPCSAPNLGTACCLQKHNHQGVQPW